MSRTAAQLTVASVLGLTGTCLGEGPAGGVAAEAVSALESSGSAQVDSMRSMGSSLAIASRAAAMDDLTNQTGAGNPADQAAPPRSPLGEQQQRLRSYEMPGITVEGEAASSLREEDHIGSYNQPRWTATRWMPDTRIYVIPEGQIEMEYWYRPTFDRGDHHDVETRMLGELEVGLPNRFQVDVYFRTDQDDAGSHLQYGAQFEVRWALADWGEIWGNPTLYMEYISLEDRPDKLEPKLLLGGEIAEGWHWGVNFVCEFEINGPDFEREYEFTSGISRSIIDEVFTIGVEYKFSLIDENNDRGHFETPFYVGPSFQWRPVPPMTINLETLVGIGGESPYGQITLNVGWEF